MKLRKYFFAVKLSIRNRLEYRFNTSMAIITRLLFFVTLYAFWRLIYATRETVKGQTFGQMISYTLLAVIVSSLVDTNVGRKIYKEIKDGQVSIYLIKPLDYIIYFLSGNVGIFLFEAIVALILFILILLTLPQLTYTLSFYRIAGFILAVFLGLIIYCQLYLIIGNRTFWIIESEFLISTVKKLAKFLAGGYIPIILFPDLLQTILKFLPFSATIYFPTTILTTSQLSLNNLLCQLTIQFLWVLILLKFNYFLWQKGIKRYESIGI